MEYPIIISAKAIDNCTLLVEFSNNEYRKYNVTKLLEKEMFSPLNNPAFFKNVSIEKGGFALVWNENIDISEYEIWTNGMKVP